MSRIPMNNEARRLLAESLQSEESIIFVQAPGATYGPEDWLDYITNLDSLGDVWVANWDRVSQNAVPSTQNILFVTTDVNPATIANRIQDTDARFSSCTFLINVKNLEELRTAARGLDELGKLSWGGGNVIFANRAAETQIYEATEAEEAAAEALTNLQSFTSESPSSIIWSLASKRPELVYEGHFTDHSPHPGYTVRLSESRLKKWSLEIQEPMHDHEFPESFLIPLNPEWDETTEGNLDALLDQIRELLPRTNAQKHKEGLLDVAADLTSLPPRSIRKGIEDERFEVGCL